MVGVVFQDVDEVIILSVQIPCPFARKRLREAGTLDTAEIYQNSEGLRNGNTGRRFADHTKIHT